MKLKIDKNKWHLNSTIVHVKNPNPAWGMGRVEAEEKRLGSLFPDLLAECQTDYNRPIEIVVIDDYPVIREGICSLFHSKPGFKVVADAPDLRSGLVAVKAKSPQVLLLDLELGGQDDSMGFITDLLTECPRTRIIVYTAHDRQNLVLEAIRSGASGYVIKSSRLERLFEAIRVVANGGSYLDPSITSLVMSRVGGIEERRAQHVQELTKRERQVLDELVSGKRNREIAQDLFISERTVKYHIRSMFAKLQAKTRTEVVRIALQKGLV
jgi:DNA-binding NarL/FixJ family response regulator